MASISEDIPQQRQREVYPSLMPKSAFPPPSKGFRPSVATKQNRFDESARRIPTIPPPRSTLKLCKDPIAKLCADQLAVLDPTGARTRLFSPTNPDHANPGDILLVRLKNGDDFAGVCLNIRQRNSPIDTAILLRGQLTRVGVEMWFKVYSPNVEGIELVQRKQRRARRAKLYYMRHPKHDMGSVEGIVRNYQKTKLGGNLVIRGSKGKDAKSKSKKNKKSGKK